MPRAIKDFSPLDPASLETAVFTFDFGRLLGVSETVLTVTWLVESLFNVDLTPASRLIGSPQIVGTQVLQKIGTAIAGETYRITATITTSASQTLTTYSHCQCVSPS
jgi:hypothetical protein